MRSNLPSRSESWKRLSAAAPPDWVLRHAVAVEALAVAMADQATRRGLALDVDLVARGALLHDIGRSITQDVRHAALGADLLREDHYPEPLIRVVERHTGAGIMPDEAAQLGLAGRELVPHTLEERIVAHADNLYRGDRRQTLGQVEEKYRARGLVEPWNRIEALHHELSQELECDLETLEPARLPAP